MEVGTRGHFGGSAKYSIVNGFKLAQLAFRKWVMPKHLTFHAPRTRED